MRKEVENVIVKMIFEGLGYTFLLSKIKLRSQLAAIK